MILVSPVAGGKTVLLSTILSNLYLMNIGISTAKKLESNYFLNIIDHLFHEYVIGGGISQHLAERKSMEKIKSIINKNERSIAIIDEIYKGTQPELAVHQALEDLKSILPKKNIIIIITTHFPEIIALIKEPLYNISLFYIKVIEGAGGEFIRTFKLLPHDEQNWWMNDIKKSARYQKWIGRENSIQ